MNLDLATKDDVRTIVREELRALLAERNARPAEPIDIDLLDVEGIAALLPSVTAPTIRAWCRSGKLMAKKVGRGYLVERAALKRFLSAIQAVPSVEPEADAARILSRIRGGK